MSEEIISFIDFTVMSDEEKYKLLNIRDNRISSLNIVNAELEYRLQQKENIIKEVREYCNDDNNFEIMTDFDTFENHNRIGNDILEILDKEVN